MLLNVQHSFYNFALNIPSGIWILTIPTFLSYGLERRCIWMITSARNLRETKNMHFLDRPKCHYLERCVRKIDTIFCNADSQKIFPQDIFLPTPVTANFHSPLYRYREHWQGDSYCRQGQSSAHYSKVRKQWKFVGKNLWFWWVMFLKWMNSFCCFL